MIWLNDRFLIDDPEVDRILGTLGWERDAVVREYKSRQEIEEHVKGRTDHVGNLSGSDARGTWVRFGADGTNLIGEHHDHVTLPDLVKDLGIKSFVYEAFYREEFTVGSAVHALQGPDTTRVLQACGVKPGEKPVRSYGIEAFYPKIAFPLPLLIPFLERKSPYSGMRGPFGVACQFAVRYLWAYAKDLAANRDPIADGGYPPTELILQGERRLAALVPKHQGKLEPFVSGLKSGGDLSADLIADDSARVELKSLVQGGIDLMFPRAAGDTRLDDDDRRKLSMALRGSPAQQAAMFNRWRDLHFEKNVAAAVADGVRFIGLGVEHVAHLVRDKAVPDGTRVYDMRSTAQSADALRFPELNDPGIRTLKWMTLRTETLRLGFSKQSR